MKSIAEFTNAFESMESAGAEQAQRADDNREWALEVEQELASERALADRLAEALISTDAIIRKEVSLIGQWDSPVIFKEALAAWKEARNEAKEAK